MNAGKTSQYVKWMETINIQIIRCFYQFTNLPPRTLPPIYFFNINHIHTREIHTRDFNSTSIELKVPNECFSEIQLTVYSHSVGLPNNDTVKLLSQFMRVMNKKI